MSRIQRSFSCTLFSFLCFFSCSIQLYFVGICINFCYLSLHTCGIQFVSVNIIKPFHFWCKLSEVKQRWSNPKLVILHNFIRIDGEFSLTLIKSLWVQQKKKHWASHKMKVQTKINREEDMSKYKKLCRTASICMLYELFQFCLVFRFNFFWLNEPMFV